MYQLSDYDYDLPAHLIAQHPAADRKRSRLLAMDRYTGASRTTGSMISQRFYRLRTCSY